MFLKQLHDQGPALIQGSAQRRVGDPVRVSEKIFSLCTWFNEDDIGSLFKAPFLEFSPAAAPRPNIPVVPARSKVKISPSHLAALLGVLGSELQLERRRVFLLGELGSSGGSGSKAQDVRDCRRRKVLGSRRKIKTMQWHKNVLIPHPYNIKVAFEK